MKDLHSLSHDDLLNRMVAFEKAELHVKTVTLRVVQQQVAFAHGQAKKWLADETGHGKLFHEITMMGFDSLNDWQKQVYEGIRADRQAVVDEMRRRMKS